VAKKPEQAALFELFAKISIAQAYEVMRMESFNAPNCTELTVKFLCDMLEKHGTSFSRKEMEHIFTEAIVEMFHFEGSSNHH